MELSHQPLKISIKKSFEDWIAPFMSSPRGQDAPSIMRLTDVEFALHDHFVSMKPIWLTYEFQNAYNSIVEEEILVHVESTIDDQRHILLKDYFTDQVFAIRTEQILSVKES